MKLATSLRALRVAAPSFCRGQHQPPATASSMAFCCFASQVRASWVVHSAVENQYASRISAMNTEFFPAALQAAIGFAGVVEGGDEAWVRVRFEARPEFTHSGGTVVQGGFVTAWLDHAMARAVRMRDPTTSLATLELKVSFLARVGAGTSIAEARVLRWGRSIVFLEAVLKSPHGELLATASSSAKLIAPRPTAASGP